MTIIVFLLNIYFVFISIKQTVCKLNSHSHLTWKTIFNSHNSKHRTQYFNCIEPTTTALPPHVVCTICILYVFLLLPLLPQNRHLWLLLYYFIAQTTKTTITKNISRRFCGIWLSVGFFLYGNGEHGLCVYLTWYRFACVRNHIHKLERCEWMWGKESSKKKMQVPVAVNSISKFNYRMSTIKEDSLCVCVCVMSCRVVSCVSVSECIRSFRVEECCNLRSVLGFHYTKRKLKSSELFCANVLLCWIS